MKKAYGLRRYFYEYVYYKAVEQVRGQTGQVVPISQAKAIRIRVDEVLAEKPPAPDGQRWSASHRNLTVADYLSAVDQAFSERVAGCEPLFGDHSSHDSRYQQLQREFTRITGVGAPVDQPSAWLPISPYDPDWSARATV